MLTGRRDFNLNKGDQSNIYLELNAHRRCKTYLSPGKKKVFQNEPNLTELSLLIWRDCKKKKEIREAALCIRELRSLPVHDHPQAVRIVLCGGQVGLAPEVDHHPAVIQDPGGHADVTAVQLQVPADKCIEHFVLIASG